MKPTTARRNTAPSHGARKRIEATAADWLARRDSGLTPADAEEFARWLASEPDGAAAAAEIEAAWAVINRPRLAGRAEAAIAELAARAHARQSRRRIAWTFGATGLAVAAAVVLVHAPFPRPVRAPAAPVATALVVHPARQLLPDGSVVVLNSGARIAVDFASLRRGVRLLQGEAHFAVTKDSARPFVVSAGGIEARAVGTEFTVRFAPDLVEVLVNKGCVAVAREPVARAVATPVSTAPEPVLVSAGARIVFPLASTSDRDPVPEPISAAELGHALVWRGERVEFTGTPLGESVVIFNRRNEIQLVLSDAALAALRVSGVFWADNPEGFARLVEASFGLHARRVDDRRIEISR